MRAILSAILLISLTAPLAWAGETYQLLFKLETLSEFEAGESLSYSRQTLDLAKNEDERLKTSDLQLAIQPDGQAELQQKHGDKNARLLSADASVGNPMAMFFMESTVREIAKLTGGSTFYIRNRLKDALLVDDVVEAVEINHAGQTISASEVTLIPFENDRNRQRMGPFADLTLTFVVSDGVPGWYHSLTAEVPLPGTDGHVYRDSISLESE